jgi:integrase
MGKKAKELSALAIGRLNRPGRHAVGGVDGLCLQVMASGARSWLLRVMVGDRRREIGLGGYPDVTVAIAKDKARKARQQIEDGIDPVEAKEAARRALLAANARSLTFKQATERYIEAMAAEWSAKSRQQWENTLREYAEPIIGDLTVDSIEQEHILQILEFPNPKTGVTRWVEKNETMSRVRSRIEAVLEWAIVRKYRRNGANPARWKGHLEVLLPAPGKVQTVKHHKAVDYKEIGALMRDVRAMDGVGALALEFSILTCARSGETIGAIWDEVDLKHSVWTVPAARMKGGIEHKVPLTPRACEILKALHKNQAPDDYIFPGGKPGKPLSNNGMAAVLERLGRDETVHGMRSTFSTWAAEKTAYPREIREACLAHAIPSDVEAAYRRTTFFDKRRRLLEEWAAYCAKAAPAVVGKVVPMHGKANGAAI